MPGQDDRSSGSRTLPTAELNPLLNPLLAENMGRWAEVYFTSPPGKREQAVLELLRELEAKRSEQDEEPTRASDSALIQSPVKAVTHARCEACGGENPATNKYCGLCGAGLGEARAYSIFGDPDSRTGFNRHGDQPETSAEEHSPADVQGEPFARERHEERYETQYDEENRNGSYPEPREFRRPYGNSLSLLQLTDSDSGESMDWVDEPEPSPPYRYYIGAVLAIIILVLGYMAWRGTQAGQNAHEVSAPPPASASDTAPAPAPAPAKTAAEPTTQSPVPEASAHRSPPADATKNPPETKSSRNQVAENTPAAPVPSSTAAAQPVPPATQAMQPSAGNGGEELAIAERYLNGAVGQRRDTAEAARWLWKSVAKHNGQATVLLSDLYLKGDGVSKNCDQARVLLDSAARKGVAGAGERLRNLPAFGCQ